MTSMRIEPSSRAPRSAAGGATARRPRGGRPGRAPADDVQRRCGGTPQSRRTVGSGRRRTRRASAPARPGIARAAPARAGRRRPRHRPADLPATRSRRRGRSHGRLPTAEGRGVARLQQRPTRRPRCRARARLILVGKAALASAGLAGSRTRLPRPAAPSSMAASSASSGARPTNRPRRVSAVGAGAVWSARNPVAASPDGGSAGRARARCRARRQVLAVPPGTHRAPRPGDRAGESIRWPTSASRCGWSRTRPSSSATSSSGGLERISVDSFLQAREVEFLPARDRRLCGY